MVESEDLSDGVEWREVQDLKVSVVGDIRMPRGGGAGVWCREYSLF